MRINALTVLIVLGLAAFLPAVFGTQEEAAAPQLPVTVFALRHAETVESTKTARDPELSYQGKVRAARLATLLGKAGVTHLYSSPYIRTKATLAPLAEALNLKVVKLDPRKPNSYTEAIAALPPGSVVVVCGHSNTIPGLVEALGGEATNLEDHPQYGPMLAHDSYDRMFQVTLPGVEGAAVSTIELRLGE
jgi:phosphohistidine phosphatase SixA